MPTQRRPSARTLTAAVLLATAASPAALLLPGQVHAAAAAHAAITATPAAAPAAAPAVTPAPPPGQINARQQALGACQTGTRPGPHRQACERRAQQRFAVPAVPTAASAPSAAGAGAAGGTAANSGDQSGVIGDNGDWLTKNGLGTPSCQQLHQLPPDAQANCRASGSLAMPTPLDHYGIDIHIDTGIGIGGGAFAADLQNLLVALPWQLLLDVIHGLIVLIDLGFSTSLLNNLTLGTISRQLTLTQDSLVIPLMPIFFALGAAGYAYHAIWRGRLAKSLGDAAQMAALMLIGLVIVANPVGTIGFLNDAASKTALGVLTAASAQNPRTPLVGFSHTLERLFDGTVKKPWCLLEFGDVHWCSDPAAKAPELFALLPKLRQAASADSDPALAGELACIAHNYFSTDPWVLQRCAAQAAQQIKDHKVLAKGLSEAIALAHPATNGDLFLAFPANTPPRNSITHTDSLFRTLCQNDNEKDCKGPYKDQAEHRTEAGTWSRIAQLALILLANVGLIVLLGFLAYKLLAAIVLKLFYLLWFCCTFGFAALGGPGRKYVAGTLMRLIGALLTSFSYAFLLGICFLVLQVLWALPPAEVGWGLQLLLISIFWIAVFLNRRALLPVAFMGHHSAGLRGLEALGAAATARRVLRMGTKAGRGRPAGDGGRPRGASAASGAGGGGRPRVPRLARRAAVGAAAGAVGGVPATAALLAAGAAGSVLAANRPGRSSDAASGAESLDEPAPLPAGPDRALAGQRAVRDTAQHALQQQAEQSLEREHEQRRARLAGLPAGIAAGAAGSVVAASDALRKRTGMPYTPRQLADRSRLLDTQAARPAGTARPGAKGPGRDYAALAMLAGRSPEQYRRADRGAQQQMRTDIDRHLDRRQALRAALPTNRAATPSEQEGAKAHFTPDDREHYARKLAAHIDTQPTAQNPNPPDRRENLIRQFRAAQLNGSGPGNRVRPRRAPSLPRPLRGRR